VAATYGYGKKTFIQGLARLSCRAAKYIVKYNRQLTHFLAGNAAALACLTSMATCLNTLCGLLNTSDR
jgi:hypothetical protein